MSNETAPNCPVSHSQPTQNARQMPAVTVAHIPRAHDLRSVITAINTMNNVVQHITRGAPQINNVYPNTEDGVPEPTPPPPPPPEYLNLSWRETGRSYNGQSVSNPDDTTQYVNIKTLAYVGWVEQVVGHKLVYKGQQ